MEIKAVVAGSVFELVARKGAVVAKGDPLLILESMKMEVVIAAPVAGELAELLVAQNDVVEAGQVLARLKV